MPESLLLGTGLTWSQSIKVGWLHKERVCMCVYMSRYVLYCLSDAARCEVFENGGVERLARLLTDQLTAEADASKTLPRIACGFLFNLVNTHGLCIFCH